jgi:hypothetical protein
MKPFLFTSAIILLLTFCTAAQSVLIYESGFDSPVERQGWSMWKNGPSGLSEWEFSNSFPYSVPNALYHDYSPSANGGVCDNWMVSPILSIPNGANLALLRSRFSGFSTPSSSDTIGIYLLQGSSNPNLAIAKLLIYDFRDGNYMADNQYRALVNLRLAAYQGSGYLAIRYLNSNCNQSWLTCHFDDLRIETDGITSINDPKKPKFNYYPNPAKHELNLDILEDASEFYIYDMAGRLLKEMSIKHQKHLSVDIQSLINGLYWGVVWYPNGSVSRFKFMKN